MPEAMSSADLVKLATLEAKVELQKGKTMVSLFGVAGLCAYAGVLLCLVAAALALGAALDGRLWAGALIVAAALFVPAIVAGLLGYRKRVTNPLSRTRAEISKEIS